MTSQDIEIKSEESDDFLCHISSYSYIEREENDEVSNKDNEEQSTKIKGEIKRFEGKHCHVPAKHFAAMFHIPPPTLQHTHAHNTHKQSNGKGHAL